MANSTVINQPGFFMKDLQEMMYGFGDVSDPDPESVLLMETLVVEYVRDLCSQARINQTSSNLPKVDKDCFLSLVRDVDKYNRVCRLLAARTSIVEAQRREYDDEIEETEEENDSAVNS